MRNKHGLPRELLLFNRNSVVLLAHLQAGPDGTSILPSTERSMATLKEHIRGAGGWTELTQLNLWLRNKHEPKGICLFDYLKKQWIKNEKKRRPKRVSIKL